MKILYISHSRQLSGFGEACRNYILAMDSVGLDVVSRPIVVNGPLIQPTERLAELEQKSSKNCDICIQHLLPHHMEHSGFFKKNIGITILESRNIKYTSWSDHLNLMDELWAPCRDIIDNTDNNGIKVPIKLVPHAFPMEKYEGDYPDLDIEPLNGCYVFYYVGEFSKRKNLEALVTAFHCEFLPSEPVTLLLKVSQPGQDQEQTMKNVSQLCNQIKDSLRLHINPNLYKSEVIISQFIPEQDLFRLHKTCDCFVNVSHGEAWGQGPFDAVALGNMAICSNTGGHKEFIHPDFLVGGQYNVCADMHTTFDGICTGRELWFDPNIIDLMKYMRTCYNMSKSQKEGYQQYYKKILKEYSYKNVGNLIKDILHDT